MNIYRRNANTNKEYSVYINGKLYSVDKNNIDVVVLSLNKKDDDSKTETFVFKSNNQNQNFLFKTCNYIDRKPECCFLASSFDEYKNDLLALSDDMLKDVSIINFASFYNHKIIDKMTSIKETKAYFDGWLVENKKDLLLLSRGAEIVFCQKDENKDIQSLLLSKKTEIKNCKDGKKTFWQKMSAWFLGNMLVLAYKEDISKLLLDSEKRQKVDAGIREIAKVLKKENVQLDTQVLLTDIYAFPDGYSSEYNSLKGSMFLSEMLGNIDRFDCPVLSEIISNATKKY